ncbi:MAG: ATPase [Candidatus Rokuibacteriota bacterium]|nr:MAG: ATPase [Candidatus Rokubacteria bacterium]
MTDANGNSPKSDKGPARPLPKRFYKAVSVVVADAPTVPASPPPYPSPTRGEGRAHPFRILLDGKPIRTPAKRHFELPSQALAEAIAAEWEAQADHVDPATMPLTRLANSAIDGVAGREAEVRADIARYAGSDLVCYRAEGPEELVQRQAQLWDPVLSWAAGTLGVRLQVAAGIMPVAQPDAAAAAVVRALERRSAFALAALLVMTTLTGSALLALAHAHGHLPAEEAWAAAHVDEDWQISRWGEDAEANARRARRWADMQAASRLLELVR